MKASSTTSLTRILRKYRPGEWVVLNQGLTKVLAAGKDPKQAAERAGRKKIAPRDQFLFRVPDPKVICIY